jgi:hypothetical protein
MICFLFRPYCVAVGLQSRGDQDFEIGWPVNCRTNMPWRLDASLVCANVRMFRLSDAASARKSDDVRFGRPRK